MNYPKQQKLRGFQQKKQQQQQQTLQPLALRPCFLFPTPTAMGMTPTAGQAQQQYQQMVPCQQQYQPQMFLWQNCFVFQAQQLLPQGFVHPNGGGQWQQPVPLGIKKCKGHCQGYMPESQEGNFCEDCARSKNSESQRIWKAKNKIALENGVIYLSKKLKSAKIREAMLEDMKTHTDKVAKYYKYTDKISEVQDHEYLPVQYYHQQSMTKRLMTDTKGKLRAPDTPTGLIKVLGDNDSGMMIQDVHNFTDALTEISDLSRAECFKNPVTKEAAYRAAKTDAKNESSVEDSLFRACEAHLSLERNEKKIQYFKHHKDKTGENVCFYGLEGYSWNFFVLEGFTEGPDKKSIPTLDENAGHYVEFEEWKKSQSPADQEDVDKFIANFGDGDSTFYNDKFHRIVVFKLEAGQRLIFPARSICHGTIVPADQARSILIFHELEPCWSTFRELKSLKNMGSDELVQEVLDHHLDSHLVERTVKKLTKPKLTAAIEMLRESAYAAEGNKEESSEKEGIRKSTTTGGKKRGAEAVDSDSEWQGASKKGKGNQQGASRKGTGNKQGASKKGKDSQVSIGTRRSGRTPKGNTKYLYSS